MGQGVMGTGFDGTGYDGTGCVRNWDVMESVM